MKLRIVLVACLAFAAALSLAGCGGGKSEGKEGDEPRELKFTLTNEGCSPATVKTGTGPTKFVVTNKDTTSVSELELLEGNHVLGEVENIKPGSTRSFTVSLQPGTFELYCPGGTKNESGKLTAEGKAPPRPTPVPGPQTDVKVSMKDFSIEPSLATAKSGMITFDVRNTGPTIHELVVVKTDVPVNALPVKEHLVDEDDTRLKHLDEVEDLEIDARVAFTVGLLPGKYALICNIASHYEQGMRSEFTVTN
jgi:uncharacterized cupredoxin-like copper-binding protein